MKYKKGDKFIVEITDVDERLRWPYRICGEKVLLSETLVDNYFTKVPVTAEELRDAAIKILNMRPEMRKKLFLGRASAADILRDFAPDRIIEILASNQKIHIGDVVETDYSKALVINMQQDPVTETNYCYCMDKDRQIRLIEESHLKKTDQSLDIEGFLQKLGG